MLSELPGIRGEFENGLLYFIGYIFGSGMSPSGMSWRMSALAFWFKLRNVRDFTKVFLVWQAMRGFRKGHVVRDGRRPVYYHLLLSLGAGLGTICLDSYEVRLFKAAFALLFFRAKVVPKSYWAGWLVR